MGCCILWVYCKVLVGPGVQGEDEEYALLFGLVTFVSARPAGPDDDEGWFVDEEEAEDDGPILLLNSCWLYCARPGVNKIKIEILIKTNCFLTKITRSWKKSIILR